MVNGKQGHGGPRVKYLFSAFLVVVAIGAVYLVVALAIDYFKVIFSMAVVIGILAYIYNEGHTNVAIVVVFVELFGWGIAYEGYEKYKDWKARRTKVAEPEVGDADRSRSI